VRIQLAKIVFNQICLLAFLSTKQTAEVASYLQGLGIHSLLGAIKDLYKIVQKQKLDSEATCPYIYKDEDAVKLKKILQSSINELDIRVT
jgi:hypothetical protein